MEYRWFAKSNGLEGWMVRKSNIFLKLSFCFSFLSGSNWLRNFPRFCNHVSWGSGIHQLHHCRGIRLHQQVSSGPVGWGCKIHWLYLSWGVRLHQQVSSGPVGWGCRIHWLYFSRGVRLHQQVSSFLVGWNCRIHQFRLCRGVRVP